MDMPTNLHTKLEQYGARCDEAMLNAHFRALVEEAMAAVPAISVDALAGELDRVVLLDVREPEEFASGHIPGKTVLTIPRGKLEFMAIEKIARVHGQDAPIVTYCLKGPRGALAGQQLQKLGFTNVRNLTGGILGWLEAGQPIESYLGRLAKV
ncbi:Rhodanese-related sulfurtransferase [Sulfurivirga caldicuralii]|uniref:Rhodanese-related sulfurtransferase n=1 Tax=Sulfurivirga caldicuralii TaxID=364032 RepID=A0A1N6DCV8_9GAMM|nr:rhodanese-like domain-containing protein [Sulfurivirga caldicuralii]SIN68668.1 Rhodanese-related sulfurtransferase [Sulfurivirga caldicuralii]